MVNPIFEEMNAIQMDIWGERDADGHIGLKIQTKSGATFRIPVVIDDRPSFEVVEGHNVQNPVKLASFRVSDWRARVPGGRNPGDGDVMTTLDRKKWSMGASVPTTDGRFEVPLYVYDPR